MGEPMIRLVDVVKRFPNSKSLAVDHLTFDIEEGETAVLVGPSGCGKTTTMKMINRLEDPTSGAIYVDGKEVTAQDPVQLRRRIGYVIQTIGLLPHRTIAQNIATVPKLLGWDEDRISARVKALTGMLELGDELLGRYPSELSGGQRQRVGVARALAADPPVMLMDEPFGAVDPVVRARLQDQFLEIQDRLRKTIVFVTHDIDEAIKMADRIAILNVGGVLEQYDTPKEILRKPANDFVKQFLGAERGLKRLALVKVGEIGVEDGPVVSPEDSTAGTLEVMERFGTTWVSVVQDGELLGWVDREGLAGKAAVSEATPRRFSAYVTAESSLREALDSLITSETQVAAVVWEGQRYRGVLTAERIGKEIIG